MLHEGGILYETVPRTMIAKSGRQLPVSYSVSSVRDASAESTGVVLVFRDETDRKRADEALKDAK